MLILAERAGFWNVVLLKIAIFHLLFDQIFVKITILVILKIVFIEI